MERSELNKTVSRFREVLENEAIKHEVSLRLLEIIEMLIDRREEDDLLVKESLEAICSKLSNQRW